MIGISIAAATPALLPAVVGISILLGTVPPDFGARAVLAILALIKVSAAAGGIAAAIRVPLGPEPEARRFG